MKYIDTHGHLNSEEFSDNVEKYIIEAKKAGVKKIIIPGTNQNDSKIAIEIANKYNDVFAMVSLHPTYAYSLSDIKWLNNIDPTKIVGVGETGIDLYRNTNPPLEIQEEIFRIHLRYAIKNNLPVAIHTRDAEKETLSILKEKEFYGIKFLIHCNTMSKE